MTAAFFIAAGVVLLLAATLVLQGVLLHDARLDLRDERRRNRQLEAQLSTFAAAFADAVERDLNNGGRP